MSDAAPHHAIEPQDLLTTAYRVLGQSLSLHRNAVAAVGLAVPALARAAVLVLAFDRQRVQWWTAGCGTAQDNPANLPDWIRDVLTESDGIRVRPIPSGRWPLPGGAEHHGHGAVARLSCSYQCQGALVLLRDDGRPDFSDADLALVAEFAAPVSRAVTAAMLYRDQADLAEKLRTTLLPAPLPIVPGLDMAAVYLPAREGLRIGGDILHVESLADGSTLCVLGDVCGKGIDAAVAGNRLRRALQVVRRVTRQPMDMLHLLNDVTFDPDTADATQFATLLLGVVRVSPDGGLVIRLAAGGHPPPLVVRRTGAVRPLHIGGMMLGAARPATFGETTIRLAPDDMCVLYTDGVIDAEGGPFEMEFGENRLATLLSGYAGMPAAVVAERIEQRASDWLAGADHDDIAVLVLRGAVAP